MTPNSRVSIPHGRMFEALFLLKNSLGRATITSNRGKITYSFPGAGPIHLEITADLAREPSYGTLGDLARRVRQDGVVLPLVGILTRHGKEMFNPIVRARSPIINAHNYKVLEGKPTKEIDQLVDTILRTQGLFGKGFHGVQRMCIGTDIRQDESGNIRTVPLEGTRLFWDRGQDDTTPNIVSSRPYDNRIVGAQIMPHYDSLTIAFQILQVQAAATHLLSYK